MSDDQFKQIMNRMTTLFMYLALIIIILHAEICGTTQKVLEHIDQVCG